MFEGFRADPDANPLKTPSGRIEIFSQTIDGFGYDDCPGHPAWLQPAEWLGEVKRYPLHLISCQPASKLHSQYDNGSVSRAGKVGGREAVWLHPQDASARDVADGDVVRVYNDRGACLASAVVTDAIRPGVVRLPTGAWYDPVEPGQPGALCRHGNPNVLTLDKGTSRLAQGPSAHTCLVEVGRWEGAPPAVAAFVPPPLAPRD
jgi:biotin/methionine sulfoxide reductase